MLLANSSSSSTTRILCSIALSRCHPEQQPDRGPHLLLTAQGDRTVEPLHDPLDQHQAQVVELGLNAETQAEALHLRICAYCRYGRCAGAGSINAAVFPCCCSARSWAHCWMRDWP